MRPHQWVKNVFVLLPVVFAQELFDQTKVLGAVAAFGCFSLLASAVYVLNDLVDVEADRAHPTKRRRPIASGEVSLGVARAAGVSLAVVALVGGWLVDGWFLATLGGYVLNNVAYSFGLKRIAYVDVLSIALGFEMRVLAGSFAAQVEPSAYLLLVTGALALFLGFGKRMHELVQQEHSGSTNSRKVLQRYSKRVVQLLLWLTGSTFMATYVVYTLDPHTAAQFGTHLLPVTSIFTLAAVIRFGWLVRGDPKSDSPTEQMLRDAPFILIGLLWTVTTVSIIYFT